MSASSSEAWETRCLIAERERDELALDLGRLRRRERTMALEEGQRLAELLGESLAFCADDRASYLTSGVGGLSDTGAGQP